VSKIILLFAMSAPAYAHTSAAKWNFEPWIVFMLVLAAWSYARGVLRLWRASDAGRGIRKWQAAAYAAGVAVLVIALVTPLDPLGNESFAAHMVQHEALMLLAAPLLVLGRPLAPYLWAMPMEWRRNLGRLAKADWFSTAWRTLTHPLSAWTMHALALWIWHAPLLFQWALRDGTVHTLQHMSFLLSALVFWWALFNARGESPNVAGAVFYLFTTAVHTSVLGALLTFSDVLWYPAYDEPPFGLSTLEDQQLGGLIMWVPGGMVYLIAALALFAIWLKREQSAAVYE
jgi:putative membrane protein